MTSKLLALALQLSSLWTLCHSTPLQWEEVRPVGEGPQALHSHASVTFQSAEGYVYLYGGEDSNSGVSSDVWVYDSAAKGWEEVTFPGGSNTEKFGKCGVLGSLNLATPSARAGHSLERVGPTALMCGGYKFNGTSTTKIRIANTNDATLMDCWFLTPLPYPRWDQLKLSASSLKPLPRFATTLAYDSVGKRLYLFGGSTVATEPEQKCYYLTVDSTDYLSAIQATYTWTSCDPTSATAVKPNGRYGHTAVVFDGSMFVLMGFASDGFRTQAIGDMWKLSYRSTTDDFIWTQVLQTSTTPDSRGFHTTWLSGFKLFLHGGQGPSGVGTAAVLEDTWQYDMYTRGWSRYESSDAIPVVSHLSINPSEGDTGVCFGGKDKTGMASGRLFEFDAVNGWSRVLPAGDRPSRRTAHLSVFDDGSAQMVVANGWALDGHTQGPVNDIWVLDVVTRKWSCAVGSSSTCAASVPAAGFSPGARAAMAGYSQGLYAYAFGGFSTTSQACAGTSGSTETITSTYNDLWALNLATYEWVLIDPSASTTVPAKRAYSALVFGGPTAEIKIPAIVIGGADLECEKATPACTNPTPLADIWVLDVAAEEQSQSDKMAEFDGEDDIVRITLPSWANNPTSMNVLWIDAWMYSTNQGKVKTILFDSYSGDVVVLRWFLEGTTSGTFMKLRLEPQGRLIKQWGPLPANILGIWHHIAFTVRFGRHYSRTSSGPSLVVAQAFFFLDGEPVDSGTTFLSLNLAEDLSFQSGLSKIYVGGPSPDVAASGYVHFEGAMDNVRIWWPSCPDTTDPSYCNPYAFLYPKLADGSRAPAAMKDGKRIQDSEVRMEYVAKPVKDFMFTSTLSEQDQKAKGLLISLTFDGGHKDGVVQIDTTYTTPPSCQQPWETSQFWVDGSEVQAVCPGCESSCVFGNCRLFDVDCVESTLSSGDVNVLKAYGTTGTCQCFNTEDCPPVVESCICPYVSGSTTQQDLKRTCDTCSFSQICINSGDSATDGKAIGAEEDFLTNEQCRDAGGEVWPLDERFCPPAHCESWTCSCDGPSFGGNATLEGTVAGIADSSTFACGCADGQDLVTLQNGADCCQYLNGYLCGAWSADGKTCESYVSYLPDHLNDPNDCPIKSCCWQWDFGPGDEEGPPPDMGGGGEEGGAVCQIEIDFPGTWVGSFVQLSVQPNAADHAELLQKSRDGQLEGVRTPQVSMANQVFVGSFVPDNKEVKTVSGRHSIKSEQHVQAADKKDVVEMRSTIKDPSRTDKMEVAPGHAHQHLHTRSLLQNSTNGTAAQRTPPPSKVEFTISYLLDYSSCGGGGSPCPFDEPLSGFQFLAGDMQFAGDSRRMQQLLSSFLGLSEDKIEASENPDVDVRMPGYYECGEGYECGGCLDVVSSECYPSDVGGGGDTFTCTDYQVLAPHHDPPQGEWGNIYLAVTANNKSHSQEIETKLKNGWLEQIYTNRGSSFMGYIARTCFATTPVASFCGDGKVINQDEQCDHGGINGLPGQGCDSECYCESDQFHTVVEVSNQVMKCQCISGPNPEDKVNYELNVLESNQLQGESNEITLSFLFSSDLRGIDNSVAPSVITVTGLTGSQTASGTLSVTCPTTPLDWDDTCWVGLEPSSPGPYQTSKADWDQEAGTLLFTVLRSFAVGSGSGQDHTDRSSLSVKLTLQNPASAQLKRQVGAQVCQDAVVNAPQLIFGGGLQELSGAGTASLAFGESSVASVSIGSSSIPAGSTLQMGAVETGSGRGFDSAISNRLPANSNFAGAQNIALDLKVVDASNNEVGLSGPAQLNLNVNSQVLKSQGGCYADEDRTVQICIPGYIGLYRYDEDSLEWQAKTSVDFSSRSNSTLYATTSSFSLWAAIATAPCYDFNSKGKAGGDRVCVTGHTPSTDAYVNLGGGTLSKMPAMSPSTKPSLSSAAQLKSYTNLTGATSVRTLVPRGKWQGLDPSDPAFPSTFQTLPARFGHTLALVSGTRILIYGGIGCTSTDNATGYCNTLSSPLDDLWEIDVLKFVAGQDPLSQIVLSPKVAGLSGQTMVVLPGLDHRVLVFGGDTAFWNVYSRSDTVPPTSKTEFTVRDISFRVQKVDSTGIDGLGASSSHSAVVNSSHVMLFGGYQRNSLTSAVFTYSLTAASPSLGIAVYPPYATGPAARGFPGIIKPDSTTLIMYGGVESRLGTSDLWQLDLQTQNWRELHAATAKGAPTSAAFSAFASITDSDGVTLISSGGLKGGYVTGQSFHVAGIGISEDQYQPTTNFYAWNNENLKDASRLADWVSIRTKVWPSDTYPGAGSDACCGFQSSCKEISWGKGCEPAARASHSMAPGYFSSGTFSVLMYGGLNRFGQALDELWYIDAETSNFGLGVTVMMRLTGVNQSTFMANQALFESRVLLYGQFVPATAFELGPCEKGAVVNVDQVMGVPGSSEFNVWVIVDYGQYFNCIIPLFDPVAWSTTFLNTTLDGIGLNLGQSNLPTNTEDPLLANPTQMRLNFFEWRSTSQCDLQCLRGICLHDSTWEPEVNQETGNALFCRSDVSVCSAGYTCTLPGKRHGHQALQLTVGGTTQAMMLIGGETTDFSSSAPALTMDVHVGSVVASVMTMYKIKTTCDTGGDCPTARRDAAAEIMGNSGSSMGRLLVFGGLGIGTSTISPFKAYLDNSAAGVQAMSDLWYLDLSQLTTECVKNGCLDAIVNEGGSAPIFEWKLVDVTGITPTGRWGAGLILDPSDNLFIMGGTTYDSSNQYTDLGDLYIYQLLDPFYKKCSATGAGLKTAIAGVPAYFLIECRDNFGDLAVNPARFRVEIKGTQAGQADLSPAPYSLSTGRYRCDYTPTETGQFTIKIYVGRGGSSFQDAIAGKDLETSNDDHELDPDNLLAEADRQYTLTVNPGDTNLDVSSAAGSSITLMTSGTIGAFVITAKDAFANRRPGGDVVNTLMYLNGSTQDPETGSVKDEKDGRYSVTYRITRSGAYNLQITFSGIIGAGTPLVLEVKSDVADISKTYAFGPFKEIQQGDPTAIFVQTRDQFGNFIRLTIAESGKTGKEAIAFYLCTTVGTTAGKPCLGGVPDDGVSEEVEYGIGPDGSNALNGVPYYGLYRVTFFPFNFGSTRPMVLHNSTEVKCYFHAEANVSYAEADPGPDKADSCITSKAATARRSVLVTWRDPESNPPGTSEIDRRRAEASAEMELELWSRRQSTTAEEVDFDNDKLVIGQQFQAPGTQLARDMLLVAPILCALVAVFIELGCKGFAFYKKRQADKVRDLAEKEREANTISMKPSNGEELPAADPQQLDVMKEKGLLTEEEVTKAKEVLAAKDARAVKAVAAIEKHNQAIERQMQNLQDQAQVIKKLTA